MAEKAAKTFAYLLQVSGLVVCKKWRVHPVLIRAGISMVLAIVLFLQFQLTLMQGAGFLLMFQV